MGLKPVPISVYVETAEDMDADEAQQIYNKMLFDVLNDEISRRRREIRLARHQAILPLGHWRSRWHRPAASLSACVKAQLLAKGLTPARNRRLNMSENFQEEALTCKRR